MKIIFALFFSFILLFAEVSVEEFKWPSGVSLLKYFEDNSIPVSLYYDLRPEDQELVANISTGTIAHVMKDEDGKILQLLVPISDELEFHLYKNKKNKYEISFDPIVYTEDERALGIEIKNSPYQDIINQTGNIELANEFMQIFKSDVNFKNIKKGDRLVILYLQKTRMNKPFGTPEILASMVEENQKSHYMYYFDGKYYDENGKKIQKFFLKMPLDSYTRISSKFTPKRFHPILKIYRAHLGIDYAAPSGTNVKSAGAGVVKFVGRQSGYGNTVIINHGSGYETLYGHLRGFAKGIKKGMSINQGQVVAYVGSTGLSSGPHLHFGLYRNKKAINPASVVQITKVATPSKEEIEFKNMMQKRNKKIQNALGGYLNPPKYEDYDNFISID